MISVFQHKTFCRFADLKDITLADVFHEVDYFKIHVKFTKTDQKGGGQWLYVAKDCSGYSDQISNLIFYFRFYILSTIK
jgi:hypothetical protein